MPICTQARLHDRPRQSRRPADGPGGGRHGVLFGRDLHGDRTGCLIEIGQTTQVFEAPRATREELRSQRLSPVEDFEDRMTLPWRKQPNLIWATLVTAVWMVAAAMPKPALADRLELRGAGSTLAAPLYEKWIDAFEQTHPSITVHYEAVGSGGGVARFIAGAVDFGATDVSQPSAQASKVERGVILIPSTAGMVALAYNLPEVTGELKLPREVYVDIFMGRIRTWDDPRIQAANPGLSLPSRNIAVIGRQDSSGTTFAFTSHLAAVSKRWSDEGPGVGKLVAWPEGAMIARGNEGVASLIKSSEGAIGYVEFGFARRLGLPVALLENKEGQFVAPSSEAGAAAISASAGLDLEGLAASIVNPPGAKAYPIVTYSWLLLYRHYPADKARALTSFVSFALDKGQSAAADLGYIELPQSVVDLAKSVVAQINPGAGAAAPASVAPRDAPNVPDEATVSPTVAAPLAPTTPPARVDTYTVVAGDTFRRVALKLYRDKHRWRDIAAANPGLDSHRRLRAGQVLKLPEPVGESAHAR